MARLRAAFARLDRDTDRANANADSLRPDDPDPVEVTDPYQRPTQEPKEDAVARPEIPGQPAGSGSPTSSRCRSRRLKPAPFDHHG